MNAFCQLFQEIRSEMQNSLMQIIHRTTQHVADFAAFQNDENESDGTQQMLVELVQMLFEQFKTIAGAHAVFLKCLTKAEKAHNIKMQLYDINFYWSQVQNVVSAVLKITKCLFFINYCIILCFSCSCF